MKELKIWNGRGHGKYMGGYIYVAAYSQKQAAELVSKACYDGQTDCIRTSELKNYYSPCWGTPMDGIIPTEPCVYGSLKSYHDKPKRII